MTINLYCEQANGLAHKFLVFVTYQPADNLHHTLAYMGGRWRGDKWRSEHFVLEQNSDATLAQVSYYGAWEAGKTYRFEQGEYVVTDTKIRGPVEDALSVDIYAVVNDWVFWENEHLTLKPGKLGEFSDSLATIGTIDEAVIAQLWALYTATD